MTVKFIRSLSALASLLCFAVASTSQASRLAYEQVGHVTEITSDSSDITIDGTSYRLAKKVAVHSTEKNDGSITADSLRPGMTIGYTSAGKEGNKKPEITSIWLLRTK